MTYLIASLVTLAIVSAIFAFGVVRVVRRRDPTHSHTPLFVAGGSLLVTVSFGVSVGAIVGSCEVGLAAVGILFLHFFFAGVVFTAEHMDWHSLTKEQADITARKVAADLLGILQDEEGDDAR